MSQAQLDELFGSSPRAARFPTVPQKAPRSSLPAPIFSPELAEAVSLFVWQGKTFDGPHGVLRNRVSGTRHQRDRRRGLQGSQSPRRQRVHRPRLLENVERREVDSRRNPLDRTEAVTSAGCIGTTSPASISRCSSNRRRPQRARALMSPGSLERSVVLRVARCRRCRNPPAAPFGSSAWPSWPWPSSLASSGTSIPSDRVSFETKRSRPARRATRRRFTAADEDYFHDMDRDRNGPVALVARGDQGPQHVAGLDGRRNDRLWDVLGGTSAGARRFPQGRLVAPVAALTAAPAIPRGSPTRAARTAGSTSGSSTNRASTSRRDPIPIAGVSGSTSARPDCPPDPFENAAKYPGVADRLARPHAERQAVRRRAPITAMRRGSSGSGCFRIPTSTSARRRIGMPSGTTAIPSYAERQGPRQALSRGHVVRSLPRRPQSDQSAGRSEQSGVGQLELERRRPVFLGRSDLFPGGGFRELRLSAASQLAARLARHLVRLHRQHQQPADDERGVSARATVVHAKRWGKETLTGGGLDNHQFNDYLKDGPLTGLYEPRETVWTPRVLKDGSDSVGALGALNRVYINIGTFSEEWLTHFNALVGGQADFADQDRGGAEQLGLLQGHRSPDARRREVLPEDDRPRIISLTRLAASQYLTQRRGAADARQGGIRRELRALPLEKLPPGRSRSIRRLRRQGLSRMLEQVLGVDPDRRVQAEDARHRDRAGFPAGQLPLGRVQSARDALADQRVQPAGDQRACQQHLGQLLVAVVQGSAVGRTDHLLPPVHRRAAHLHDAGRRARLHAAAVARQPLVDGARSC